MINEQVVAPKGRRTAAEIEQIVGEAKSFENPQEIGKPQFVRFQKRLLAAVREGTMKSSSTSHAAHAEYVGLLSLSADIGVRFIPVHLRFLPPGVGLRNERLALDQSQLNLPLANIATNRGFGDANGWKFLADPRPDPMCRVSLLSGRVLVPLQDGLDEGLRRFYSFRQSNDARVQVATQREELMQALASK
jgi:hypothetical protein